ncbi:MFS transporter [soil metagenome]
MTAIAAFDDDRAKRAAITLAIAQALSSSATVILVASAGLVGTMIAPSRAWATAPITAFVIGTALTTIPAALLMKRVGRRPGFMLGAGMGVLAGLIAIYAVFTRNFVLFCFSAFLQGVPQGFMGYYRFAAADIASPAFRPRAISWVMTGGVAAAVFGTLIIMVTADLWAPVTYAGTYMAMAILCALAMVVLSQVDIPLGEDHHAAEPARPLAQIVRNPRTIVAMVTAMLAFGMMNLVMTATPIAMVDCGFDKNSAFWVIQWHVLAMYIPSFFTGSLIARYGVERICALGMIILAASGASALLGLSFANFAAGLILLGLGWNFGYVGGTAMLTECYRPSERAKVQALNDFAVAATVAAASLTSGQLFDIMGWNGVITAMFPAVALALGFLAWQRSIRPATI